MFILDLVILVLLILVTVYFRRVMIQMNGIKLRYKELMEINENLELLKNSVLKEISSVLVDGKKIKSELEDIFPNATNVLNDMDFTMQSANEIMDKLEFMIINHHNHNTPQPVHKTHVIAQKRINHYPVTTDTKTFKDLLEEFCVK